MRVTVTPYPALKAAIERSPRLPEERPIDRTAKPQRKGKHMLRICQSVLERYRDDRDVAAVVADLKTFRRGYWTLNDTVEAHKRERKGWTGLLRRHLGELNR